MAIDRKEFAENCVREGLHLGANPHYMLAVAQVRSGISDERRDDQVGPFRLTQAQWDANQNNDKLTGALEPSDIANWRMQCHVFAMMSHDAFETFVSMYGRAPRVPYRFVLEFWWRGRRELFDSITIKQPSQSLVCC